ncbi:YcnI family protein [Actinoplanes sp. NBRC 103695]|uniref:YcnI family copper-binding membrane protein n=1 Tax=Actinoplanes sp. NBRC 103695 TaxID=3032202 RepID=UPI0024A3C092|nr:YcnI family protein [Actinoplanes sp. NBRC 103695]GLZ01127.1 membrane protein [Actinoplanes sp. NBRC 103695]
MRTWWLRTSAAVMAGVVLATAVIPAGAASAHVSVSPTEAGQGGFAVLTFRVPNERSDAKTTKVQLFFPTDNPIIGTTVRQTVGWTAQVARGALPKPVTVNGKTLTQGVLSVTWIAKTAADGVGGTDYQEFGVSVGPLPAADRVVFKALQTYDDGELVRWIDEPVDGQPEPEAPAVVLNLTAGGEGLDEHGQPLAPGVQPTTPSAAAQDIREPAPSKTPLVIAIAALVIAVAALLSSLLGRRRAPTEPAANGGGDH